VAPDSGFQEHGHENMEIVTYLLEGRLAHSDSEGNRFEMLPGDVQAMSAGRGIRHSEVNPDCSATCELLQIWILPTENGTEPGYSQRHFPVEERHNRLCLVASGDAAEGSLRIGQDAKVYAALLDSRAALEHTLADGRRAWLQVARGTLRVNGTALGPGDGAAVQDESRLTIVADRDAEFLLFDLR